MATTPVTEVQGKADHPRPECTQRLDRPRVVMTPTEPGLGEADNS
jgi:hypothetical protein